MSNAQVLSSGSEVYAKKRKARQEQLTEVSFDPEARKYGDASFFHIRYACGKLRREELTEDTPIVFYLFVIFFFLFFFLGST